MDIPCICPPKEGQPRHDKDTVTLRERLDFRSSLMVQNTILDLKQEDPDATGGDVLAVLTEAYVLAGIESWSVVDEQDKVVEPTKPAIRQYLLSNVAVAMTVAEEADGKYREAILVPLAARVLPSSPPTPTDESTSQTSTSEAQNLNHSSPSSISSSPMDDTATTLLSPVGGSSSSRS